MNTGDETYAFLTTPFQDWIHEKLEIYYEKLENAFFYGDTHQALLGDLNLSEQNFYERFIKPYEGLSSEQLTKVAAIQSQLGHKYLRKHTHFIVKPVLEQYMNAIEWTVLNISDLNLNGLNVEPNSDVEKINDNDHYLKEPYRQCRYCGRFEKDPRDKLFGERQLSRCKTVSGDTENRNCSKEWEKFTHNTRDKINNKSKAEGTEYFLARCQERFEFNLEHAEWTIGTVRHKPQWLGPFIDLEKSYV